jgi:hypothetical protein
MIKHSEEFKRAAVRIALTSGLPRGRGCIRFGDWQVHPGQVAGTVSAYRFDLSAAGRSSPRERMPSP